jgi:membrane protease YdiL (CAAX protease family)
VVLPLWLDPRGLAAPYAPPLLYAMMLTPAASALLTRKLTGDTRPARQTLGLAGGRFRRLWPYLLLGWLGPLVLGALAVALAALAGAFRTDLRHFSGLAEMLTARGPLPFPITVIVGLQVVQLLVAGPLINSPLALGEELGWRGYLRDGLATRPRWQLIVITGVVWGGWHAPLILLGYNFPGLNPVAGVGMMIVFTLLVSALLEWLRGASGSVWSTALAHGSVNALQNLAILVAAAGQHIVPFRTGLLGWPGWVVMGAAVVILVVTRRLRLADRG